MTKLIGQITYPQEATFSVEYVKLYSENESSLLEFRLVNNSKKTVNAYRIDLSYSHNGEEKSQAIQGKNLELVSQSKTDVITVSLPAVIEEGTLTLSAVIYDDLTHGTDAPAYPFASFDVISRMAEKTLAGQAPVATPVAKPTAKPTASASLAKETTAPAPEKAEAAQETGGKKSHLPLILALSSLGGIIFTFFLRLVSFSFLATTSNSPNYLSYLFLITSLIALVFYTGCSALSLTAILLRKKNPSQSVAVIILAVLSLLCYLYLSLSYGYIFLMLPVLLLIVFLIIALVKKDLALLISTISLLLVFFLAIGWLNGCFASNNSEKPAENNPNAVYAENYIILQVADFNEGECIITGFTRGSSQPPIALTDPCYLPEIDGRFDLVIPEYTADGRRVVGIQDGAFNGNTSVRSVTLSSGVRFIGMSAFTSCLNLVSANLCNLQTLRSAAFQNCTSLTTVTGLEHLVEMWDTAFAGCENLRSISLGNELVAIGNAAFANTGLTSVVLPANLNNLGGGVFQKCEQLTSVEIYANISQIPQSAFVYCHQLQNIRIPRTVVQIEHAAFLACHNLLQIYYEGSEENWNSISIAPDNEPLSNTPIEFYYYQ